MDELSKAWNTLHDNGAILAIASPNGGSVEADRFDAEEPENARFLADNFARESLLDTLPIRHIDPAEWDAVFVIGGKGAMIDLAGDRRLGALLGKIHAAGGVVAAVCHGPAALTRARDSTGKALVAGRRVTGFTNEEESQFAKRWLDHYPFLIEDELIKQGGRWSESPLMLPHVVADDRLVTGQNPYSTAEVADELIRQLGRTPRDRSLGRDEKSLGLLMRAYAGDYEYAADKLAQSPEDYHPQLIGIVGHYQLHASQGKNDLDRALVAMRLAEPYMTEEPTIQVSLAQAEWQLGRKDDARKRLEVVVKSHPNEIDVDAIMKTWSE